MTNNRLSTSQHSGILLLNATTGTSITRNTLSQNASNGLSLGGGITNTVINQNCFLLNQLSGVAFTGVANSGVTSFTGNSFEGNLLAGLSLDPASYTPTPPPPSLHAEGNWWGSASGPNYVPYNAGTGDRIVDNNVAGEQTVAFAPFLTLAPPCAALLTATISSVAVPSGRVSCGAPVGDIITVTGAVGLPPTGTVTVRAFRGSHLVFTSAPLPLVNGVAVLAPSFRSCQLGVIQFVATYNGDSNYGAVSTLPTDLAQRIFVLSKVRLRGCAHRHGDSVLFRVEIRGGVQPTGLLTVPGCAFVVHAGKRRYQGVCQRSHFCVRYLGDERNAPACIRL